MLRIHYGPMDGVIYNTAVYFRNVYRDEWLEDDFAKRVIRAVDKSEVVGPHLIESRVLGPIPPEGLSGGVKTLLLINFMPDKVDFGMRGFTIEIENTGQVVHSMSDLVSPAGLLLSGDNPGEVLSAPLVVPRVEGAR